MFGGLTGEQWKIKDKPYWDSIDRRAIKNNGGFYIGDLPSQTGNPCLLSRDSMIAFIYHPSIDSTIIERHYYLKIKQ